MDYEGFLEFIEHYEEQPIPRMPRVYLRDALNPFNFYNEHQFKERYRFSKGIVRDIVAPLIYDELSKLSQRGLPILPIQQLFIALRFYATGNFQIVDGDLQRISQPTVSRIIKRVSEAVARHLPTFVKFPQNAHQQRELIRRFYQVANFPAVSSCVDGVHILIGNPGGEVGEIFRNRKGNFSLNVQIACGPSMEILDIVVRYPGSMHDNVIFERSSLRVKYENNEVEGKILGDNGYACKRYLLTPVINPVGRAEQLYNRAHKRTRNIIERTFGIWKRRFPCLKRGLNTNLGTTTAVICAVAVLHNIGAQYQDAFDFIAEEDEDNDDEPIVINNDQNADGLHYRHVFIVNHFGNI